MDDIIARGDAEQVPESEISNQTTWYIPHHGVYHPQKPGKIHVVFDCSAKFQSTSLNEHLLTGPDLTNTLVGVLCRLDMVLGEHKMERALGVQWCITTDKFQFKVRVKDHPFTRRGVLSVVASVFDPLGFVAPVILKGK